MNIQIAEISPEYWEQYKTLRREAISSEPLAFLDSFNSTLELHDDKWIRHLNQQHTDKTAIVLFAIHETNLIGIIVGFFNHRPNQSHIATFASAYVKPEYRKHGVADLLINELIERMKAQPQIRKIQLEVVEKLLPALQFFKKHGFKQTGLLKDQIFYKGQYYNTVLMEKFL